MNPIALAFLQGAVGFGIGAGTNDLAIRWIFHAVFAKKKRAIAESVQEIISNELMTPEKIAARLAATDSIDALQSAIEKHLDVVFARDLPSLDKLAADSGGEMLVKEAADSVVNIAVDELAKRLPFPGVIRAVVDPFGQATGRLIAKWARGIPIGRPDRFARPELRRLLAKRLATECVSFLQAHLSDLIEKTRIWDVVYNSVANLDAKEMEAVTRHVANRELHGITWLGGVIGFVVGFSESILVWLCNWI